MPFRSHSFLFLRSKRAKGVRWLDGKQTLNAKHLELVEASPVKKIISWISWAVKPAGYSSLTIEAPGSNPEESPWGWVEHIELVTPPAPAGMAKTEYRYDGEDHYQASLYSPAADLQAGESIHVPLSDGPDFQAGAYRLSVLSIGTREQFTVKVNGQPVGAIRKKRADYSDTDYSQDYMEGTIFLSPGDILTLTGQDGDYFGWVNYILLEKDNA